MFLYLFLLWGSLLPVQAGFEWVSFNMVQRINTDGKTTRMDSQIYFRTNGDMVTYLTQPVELFLLNNSKGELQVYNPSENSVYKSVNYNQSSQNNTFYFFLNENANMGLDQAGYRIGETKVDEDMLVTNWLPPVNLNIEISAIEVVSDDDRIVFMGFLDLEGVYFKKIYFYNFNDLRGISFPHAITDITYFDEDSVITKTTFHDFQYDDYRDKEIMEFQVPENARLVK